MEWIGIILLLIIAIIVYKLIQKITGFFIKILTFVIVLIVVYFLLTNFGLL